MRNGFFIGRGRWTGRRGRRKERGKVRERAAETGASNRIINSLAIHRVAPALTPATAVINCKRPRAGNTINRNAAYNVLSRLPPPEFAESRTTSNLHVRTVTSNVVRLILFIVDLSNRDRERRKERRVRLVSRIAWCITRYNPWTSRCRGKFTNSWRL